MLHCLGCTALAVRGVSNLKFCEHVMLESAMSGSQACHVHLVTSGEVVEAVFAIVVRMLL